MKNEATTNVKIKYTVDKKSFFGHSAVLLLVMSAIFRVIGCWGLWNDTVFAVMQLLLPIACCLLLVLCISFLGKKGFFLSCVPVVLGAVFFIFKSFGYESKIQLVLCVLLSLIVAVIYTGTVIGSIHTKWLLPPLFGLPFIYHVFVVDLPALSNVEQPVTFSAGMQEMSVLCIMAAMFCLGLGLKKVVIEKETTILAEPAVAESAPVDAAVTETAPVCAVVDGQMQCEGEPVLANTAVEESAAAETENTEVQEPVE